MASNAKAHKQHNYLWGDGTITSSNSCIVEEYKARKNCTAMKLRFSNDIEIQDNSPEIKTFRKLKALM